MNQNDNFSCNIFMLTSAPIELSFLKYQVNYHISGSIRYIRSFTILMGSRVIKKYTLKKMLLIDNSLNLDRIIADAMFDDVDLTESKGFANKNSINTPSKRFNKEARNQAAINLFSDLGI